MAADPDPYFALPKLYGGPAYARPTRVVQGAERPFDPDDLPIAAARMADEHPFAEASYSSASYQSIGSDPMLAAVASASPPVGVVAASSVGVIAAGATGAVEADPATGAAPSANAPGSDGSRFRLRTLTNRLGPRSK